MPTASLDALRDLLSLGPSAPMSLGTRTPFITLGSGHLPETFLDAPSSISHGPRLEEEGVGATSCCVQTP